jgi:hypothetical protein
MMHVIVCGYKCEEYFGRCLDSLKMQTFQDFKLTCGLIGGTEDEERVFLVQNTLECIYTRKPQPEDIIVLLDADDFLCDELALETIDNLYKNYPQYLLTYGSYVNLSTNERGKFSGPYEDGENFRTAPWRASHLKTFKFKLFDALPKVELQDEDGEFYKCCADRAMMIPMMEMAGHDRIRYVPTVTYCYNDMNPISVWKTMRELSKATRERIANRPPLAKRDDL